MRTFELLDSTRRAAVPCATIMCDQVRGTFSARVADWAGPADVPLAFVPFVERGVRDIPPRWVESWVEERIAPPSRQNIGDVLRAHHLQEYDACELLASNQGKSSQDDFYLREIPAGYRGSAALGRQVAQARAMAGMTQTQLAEKSGLRQETVNRIERGAANPTMATLEALADALGKRLDVSIV